MITWSLWVVLIFWSVNMIMIATFAIKDGGYTNIALKSIFSFMIAYPAPFILLDYLLG